MENLFGTLGSTILVSIFLFGIPYDMFDGIRGILLLIVLSIVGVIFTGWGIHGFSFEFPDRESG